MGTDGLDGRVALVTGAAQGMGQAIANVLADHAARLVINDLDEAALAATVEKVGARTEVATVGGDVTKPEDVARMLGAGFERFGGIDILVNNAGVLRPTKAIDIPVEEWDLVVEVNLKGTFLCSQAVLPHMMEQGWGRIINLSSTAGKNISTVGGAHYTAAKAGVLGFTRHLANEVAEHGITVNAVCPGLFDTDMVRLAISQEALERYAGSFPVRRLGRPEEVGELIAFLASERAAYITGASVDINGGDLMI